MFIIIIIMMVVIWYPQAFVLWGNDGQKYVWSFSTPPHRTQVLGQDGKKIPKDCTCCSCLPSYTSSVLKQSSPSNKFCKYTSLSDKTYFTAKNIHSLCIINISSFLSVYPLMSSLKRRHTWFSTKVISSEPGPNFWTWSNREKFLVAFRPRS